MGIIPGCPVLVDKELNDVTPVKIGFLLILSIQIKGPPKSSWYSPLKAAVVFVFDGRPAHN